MTKLDLVTVVAVAAEAAGEIITVFGPKGGAGTTTLATNLGVVLAGAGHQVCVVDLDVAAGPSWPIGRVHVGCSADVSADCGKFPPERLITPRPALPQQLTPAAFACSRSTVASGPGGRTILRFTSLE